MIAFPANARVFLCSAAVDMRKSFDGLGGLVESVFQKSVFDDGHLFLFVNKRRDRLKALWWDRDGLVIFYKRLERGTLELPRASASQPHVRLDAAELAMMLAGVPLATRRRPRYQRAGAA
jgi:transposase